MHIIKHQHSWPSRKKHSPPHFHDLEQFTLKRFDIHVRSTIIALQPEQGFEELFGSGTVFLCEAIH
jgi:hypothetical protein